MKKAEKVLFVENLATKLGSAKSLVLIDLTSLKVSQQQMLSRRVKEVGGRLLIAKNTLFERALGQAKEYSDQVADLKPSLIGPTAIVTANDDGLAPLQILGKFIKEFELPKLKVGIVGNQVQSSTNLLALSRLPGREVLGAQVVGSLMGPLYGLVGTLQGKMQELIYILSTKSQASNSKQQLNSKFKY